MYDLELERLSALISRGNYSRVALQLPDGFLGEPLTRIIETIRELNKNIEVFVNGDPCFGACDLGIQPALTAGCEALFHFGHTPYAPKLSMDENCKLDIFYFEAKANISVRQVLEIAVRESRKRNLTSVGLATTVQHIHKISTMEAMLKNAGLMIHVGEQTKRLLRGQVLGCDVGHLGSSLIDKIDGTIFVGGGRFHALAILRKTKKPVLAVDPYNKQLTVLDDIDLRKYYQKRYAAVDSIKNAQRIGILVSTKTGQYNQKLLQLAQDWLELHGKTFLTVLVSTVIFPQLLNFPVDGWISTLCPRVALDDSEQLPLTIINLDELDWDQYIESDFNK